MFLRNRSISKLSDEELVIRLQGGDHASLAILWDRYAHLLFGVAMKYVKAVDPSKDLVMELFAGLPKLLRDHQVRSFRGWVHSVMRNRCLMLLRKTTPDVKLDPALLTQEETSDDAMLHEASLEALETAITELPEGQQRCIHLFYLERKSYQQVAHHTGYSLDRVRSHLQNGRRNLRIILERHGEHS